MTTLDEKTMSQLTLFSSAPVTNGHFKITRLGLIVEGEPDMDAWLDLCERTKFANAALHWVVGDIAKEMSTHWGMYDELAKKMELEVKTLENDKCVSQSIEFSRRRENLSFGHHETVTALRPEDQDYWLDEAEKYGWTRAELRRQLKKARRIEAVKTPLPTGVYNVIYADPPWRYSNEGFKGSAEEHYPTLSTEDICQHEIAGQFASDAVLFLWVTNPLLEDGLQVMRAWGFDYKTNLCWVKDRPTYGELGFYVYGRHELLLLGTRGSFLAVEKPESVFYSNKEKHSAKPHEVYEIIETMYPGGSYLEVFARKQHPGWDSFGNEVNVDGNTGAASSDGNGQ